MKVDIQSDKITIVLSAAEVFKPEGSDLILLNRATDGDSGYSLGFFENKKGKASGALFPPKDLTK